MNRYLVIVASILLLTSTRCLAQENKALASRSGDGAYRTAYEKAFDRLVETGFDLRDRVFVIRKKGRFVVVSCLNEKPEYREQMHLVYDPAVDKIVYELGSQ